MNDFDNLIADIEQEARREGPAAVAELRALDDRFRIASQIMTARKSAKISQRTLAERSGVQQAEISKIERGEINPTTATLGKLLKPLGKRLAIVDDDRHTVAA